MPTHFTLPELGENITSGDVLRVLVKTGDTLDRNQPVLELETDKATIEVPSSVAGQVTEVNVKAGDTVKVGQAILSVAEPGNAPAPKTESAAPSPKDAGAGTAEAEHPAEPVPPAKPVPPAEAGPPAEGGPRAGRVPSAGQANAASPDPDERAADAAEDSREGEAPDQPVVEARNAPAGSDKAGVKVQRGQKVVDISRGTRAAPDAPAPPEQPPAPASPSVRRMARELGVDIHDVAGSGSGGRISADDVKAHVSRLVSSVPATGVAPAEPLPDFSRWGEIERQAMRGVRRKTAQHLAAAWTSIPHVTQHELADITALDELRKQYAKQVEAAGGSLTVTAILVKVVAAALRRFPQVNSSVDMAAEEIVYKKYVHIGVAVDTDHGLLVPVIRDADTKNVTQISVELVQLSEKARARKLSLEEMQGGCFSLSNLGGIGGTAFTPVVNAPEVAILGISRARMQPVWRPATSDFAPRLMLPLSLSYDHRVVDGAEGLRFLRWIVEALEQPFMLVLQA
jgi:pyruvate dehydrogenase E2 component (dihydrolipoamide acetyltransferase)